MIVTISGNKPKRRVEPLVGLKTWAKLLCTILVVQNLNASYQVVTASRNSNLYDPEQQDGIPVFSARSIPTKQASSLDDDWGAGDQIIGASDQPQVAQRRQGDADLDDGMEDEDDDEYKSGSSPRESVENPSYGESTRSARDGDEIEEFFDKHLGPPQEATAADESSTSALRQDVPASDPDDHYEAAASGPIANIIHSLLSHNGHEGKHKRPFLKIATTTSASAPLSSSSTDSADSSSGSTSSSTSVSSSLPLLSLISAAAEKVDKSTQPSALKTSQSAQSLVKTAPISLAFAPVAASSLIAQDTAAPEQSTGVQEIYIGRRPSVMNYLQKAYAQQQQHQHQSRAPSVYTMAGSSNLWRGAPSSYEDRGPASAYEQDQLADYARYPIAASYMNQREQSTEAASSLSPESDDDQTVTYNLSFGSAPTSGEETPPAAGAAAASQNSGQEESPSGTDTNEPVPQMPQRQHAQQTPRGYVPYSTRYSASSTNYFNSNNNPYQGPHHRQTGDFSRATGQSEDNPFQQQQHHHHHHHQMLMMQQQRHYRPNAGHTGSSTRYHRDPSDNLNSAAAVRTLQEGLPQQYAGARYAGTSYSGNLKGNELADDEREDADESATMNKANAQAMERQRLLASLDQEIKASPHYQSNNAAVAAAGAATTNALARMYASGSVGNAGGRLSGTPRQHMVAIKTLKKSYQGGDLDSYNSFHSEEDPYKSITSTSRMINDPSGVSSRMVDDGNSEPAYGARSGDRIQTADSNFQTNQSLSGEQPLGVLKNTNSPSLIEPSSSLPTDWSRQNIANQQEHLEQEVANPKQRQQQVNSNLLTGRLNKLDTTSSTSLSKLASSKSGNNNNSKSQSAPNSRVRREDPDEREIDGDSDDDGVWVDDDEDDDSRQQSSDVNETAQEPEGEEDNGEDGQHEDASNSVPNPMRSNQMNPPGVIGGPHGYELSPNDLMIYHG